MSFLKTFYLMERGYSFYEANYLSIQGDARQGQLPPFISGWRLPFIFMIWQLFFTNGIHIWFGFIFLNLIVFWSAFRLVSRYTWNLMAFFLLMCLVPYYFGAAISENFLLVEWWAASFALIGLFLLSANKKKNSILFILFASLIREFYIILIILTFILSLLSKDKKIRNLSVVSLLIFILYYILHYLNAESIYTTQTYRSLYIIGQNFGEGGVLFLRKTLAYNTHYMPFAYLHIQLPTLMLIIVYILGIPLLLQNKTFVLRLLLVFIYSITTIFGFIGSLDNDYWGVLYLPMLFITFFIILGHYLNLSFPKSKI